MISYPPLKRDRAFWGITATQFLGAFNDNVFKMLLMLICADYVKAQQGAAGANPYFDPYQTTASLLFAFAFVMFSGFAGYLSDRYEKKTIVVLCKVAEILVMAAGLFVFLLSPTGSLSFIMALFGVLFFMGLQSAFFGPSKYGILPEMFSETDLPAVNGAVLGTTFLAIIFGTALAGLLKDALAGQLWLISLFCVALAVIGTATSTLLRRTPAAQPQMQFGIRNWFIEPEIWKKVIGDVVLFKVLLVYSVFWFVGGVVALTITLIGQVQMNLSSTTTALFNAAMGMGIGTGCAWAAMISKKDVRMELAKIGSVGLSSGMAAAAIIAIVPMDITLKSWLFGIALFVGGFFGGWVAIPLQVFIQAHPPAEFKGRVVAVMNIMTWIGILMASVYYFAALALTGFQLAPSWILLSVGIIMMLAGLFSNLKSPEHLVEERDALPAG